MPTTKGPEVPRDLTDLISEYKDWVRSGGLVTPDYEAQKRAELKIIEARRRAAAQNAAAAMLKPSPPRPIERERFDVHAAVVAVADRLGIKDPGYHDHQSYDLQPQDLWLMCQVLTKILDKTGIGLPGDVSSDMIDALLKGQEEDAQR